MKAINVKAVVEALLTLALGFLLPLFVFPRTLFLLGYNGVELKLSVEITYVGFIPSLVIKNPYSYVFIGALITSSSGAAYIALRQYAGVAKGLKKELLEFLSLIIAHVSSGSRLFEALEKAVPEVKEPTLKNYLEMFFRMVSLGEDPDDIINKHALRKTPKEVRLVLTALSVAFKSGGAYVEVLRQTHEYLTQLLRLDMLRYSKLSEYKLVIVLSIIAYALSATITAGLLTSIYASSITLIGGEIVSVEVVKSAYYTSSIALTLLTSIIISKVIEDNVLKTFKYVALLFSLVTVIYVVSELITL